MSNQQLVIPVAAPGQVKPVVLPFEEVETAQVVQPIVGRPETADQGMNGLEFTASAISSLAWPVAAVIIAAIFRKQITGLLAKIRKLIGATLPWNYLNSWIGLRTRVATSLAIWLWT